MKIKKIIGGQTVGYIEIKPTWCGDQEIAYLWTHPDHRGKGIASSLIRKAQEKFPILIGFFDPADDGLNYDQMVAWHKKLGFKQSRYAFWRGSKKTLPVMYWVADSKMENQ